MRMRLLTATGIYLLLTAGTAMAAQKGVSSGVSLRSNGGANDELRERFVRSMSPALRPVSFERATVRIEALRALEVDFDYDFQTATLIQEAVQDDASTRVFFRIERLKGIQSLRPIEMGLDRVKSKSPLMPDESLFWLSSIHMVNQCIASENAYNLRFLKYIKGARVKPVHSVAYLLVFRMWRHGCITESEMLALTRDLAPKLVAALEKGKLSPGEEAIQLFLLSATKRFDEIPADALIRFVRKQERDGSWTQTGYSDRSASAAHGAYVMATMLRRSHLRVEPIEITQALLRQSNLPVAGYPGLH